jgi:hypothetical protein
MRSVSFPPLVLAVAFGLLAAFPSPPRAVADRNAGAGKSDDGKTEKVKFDTVDQVELHGTFYQPAGGPSKKAPCALLLHKIESDSSKDGWDQLARDLSKAGYAVLSFDFRGHGESTAVGPNFWGDRSTAALTYLTAENVRQYKTRIDPSRPKDTISIKDFQKSYYPILVNDIAAAKGFLDRKNDSGECNSANLTLIGAEDGATLGALWMYTELNLFKVTQINQFTGAPLRLATTPEGKDVAACVWLSISPSLGSRPALVSSWLGHAGKERKIPMAFLCGEKDSSVSFTRSCYQAVKPSGGGGSKLSGEIRIDDSKYAQIQGFKVPRSGFTGEILFKESSLKGSQLLGDHVNIDSNTTAREWIVSKYLKAVRDEQVAPAWDERDVEKTAYAWSIPGRTIPVPAKSANDKNMGPVPVGYFVR